jgi:hypothetical protein
MLRYHLQDAFPLEDVVWGRLASEFAPVPSLTPIGIGIAYTIDPAYEAEVRDYLGKSRTLHLHTALNLPLQNRLSRKGYITPVTGRLVLISSQDGYTMESLDIYGIVDGKEQIVIQNVRYLLSSLSFNSRPPPRPSYVPLIVWSG